jgi:hypothetical protein
MGIRKWDLLIKYSSSFYFLFAISHFPFIIVEVPNTGLISAEYFPAFPESIDSRSSLHSRQKNLPWLESIN